MGVPGCLNCSLPALRDEGRRAVLLPDGWGWTGEGIVCPTCVRLGVPVDEIAKDGVN